MAKKIYRSDRKNRTVEFPVVSEPWERAGIPSQLFPPLKCKTNFRNFANKARGKEALHLNDSPSDKIIFPDFLGARPRTETNEASPGAVVLDRAVSEFPGAPGVRPNRR